MMLLPALPSRISTDRQVIGVDELLTWSPWSVKCVTHQAIWMKAQCLYKLPRSTILSICKCLKHQNIWVELSKPLPTALIDDVVGLQNSFSKQPPNTRAPKRKKLPSTIGENEPNNPPPKKNPFSSFTLNSYTRFFWLGLGVKLQFLQILVGDALMHCQRIRHSSMATTPSAMPRPSPSFD
eukprot:Gb_13154 [translate_table: standard]